MKKKLNEIFDEAKPQELDQFSDELNAPELPDEVLASVKSKVYTKTNLKKEKKTTKSVWLHFGTFAACFILVVSVLWAVPMLQEDDPAITVQNNNDQTLDTDTLNTDNHVTTDPAETLSASYSFTSFEDFENHEKKLGTKALSHYYTPSALTQDYELSQITKRDNVYVMLEYTLSSNKVVSAEKLSEYDAERLSTLICRYSLYSDGKKALEESFISKGYEPIEHEGKVYYRWDEHAENNPDKRIIGYEIAFLEDGKLIFMHLPAVDTFENMMKYANIIKVDID